MKMKLKPKPFQLMPEGFLCDLTIYLDMLAGLPVDSIFKHYILVDDEYKHSGIFPIRVPGMTIGSVSFDIDYKIQKICINSGCLQRYKDNAIELINKEFIGVTIEF